MIVSIRGCLGKGWKALINILILFVFPWGWEDTLSISDLVIEPTKLIIIGVQYWRSFWRTGSSLWTTNTQEMIRRCPCKRYHHGRPGRIYHSYGEQKLCCGEKILIPLIPPKKVRDEAYHILSASHPFSQSWSLFVIVWAVYGKSWIVAEGLGKYSHIRNEY